MGFNIPNYLTRYLSECEYRKPFENFVNNGTYYAGLDAYWINYMTRVVRPCIAYSTHSVDGVSNSALSTGTGLAIVNGATRLIKGERVYFEEDDESCKFLSDVWAPWASFDIFLERAIRFMLIGGTCPFKLDIDAEGRSKLSAYRIDRTLISTDESGNVTEAVFFVSLLSSLKNANGTNEQYWLVEHRKYNLQFKPVVVYKVFKKSGIANAETLPSPYVNGIGYKACNAAVKRELNKLGIYELNEEIVLPYRDGLGVWQLLRTATNSCVPDAFLGDPLLYGLLDLLWSMDVVFSGPLTDVLLGRGKILVPKQFLGEITAKLGQINPNFRITTDELNEYGDETLVYIQPSMFDKDKQSPTPVQFEIRADQYKTMWELYQREAAVRAGYSPTSLFPHRTPDNSAKTATEVTAEENLTRASVQAIHGLIVPVLNRALREVLYQNGFSTDASIKLSDYIGNKLQHDQNIRENYQSGLLPKEVAVQKINNLSVAETYEYLEKLKTEEKEKAFGGGLYNEQDYFGEVLGSEIGGQRTKSAGAGDRTGAD